MLIVLKYGGNAMRAPGEPDPLLDAVARRHAAGDRIVLVHGGGPHIDVALRERAIVSERVAGLRVTTARVLEVAESVLCGTVNKALVRALLVRGISAAGISGQDGALLVARFAQPLRGVSLGFVGEIETVRPAILDALLGANVVPVVAPLGIAADGGTALNVNADSAAGAIAGALRADAYVVVTDVARIRRQRDDPASGIARIDAAEARALVDNGTFADGMRPKVESALDALARGARRALVADSLERALAGDGTTILGG